MRKCLSFLIHYLLFLAQNGYRCSGLTHDESLPQYGNSRFNKKHWQSKSRLRQSPFSPNVETLQFGSISLTQEDLDNATKKSQKWIRRASWNYNKNKNNNNNNNNPYDYIGLADPTVSYDKWAQAYRMLGGFIDCDHPKSNNKNGNQQQQNSQQNSGCSRWMMWAAYIDPNYSGNGYNEYFGDNPVGKLDCHDPKSDWQLLGVYRQEFYQFIEQISKHLWAIDEYEYVVALAGLSYMTKYECFQVGTNSQGETIYASVAPMPEATFEMALYTDSSCIIPDEDTGLTYDSYGLSTNLALSSQDKNGNGDSYYDSDMYSWWSSAQEYTFTDLNDVYESFKYCTSCVDYPTYQDGYFIGDTGTDDDDLINQCWKFYSHNSYNCDADCIALGHAQGTIMSVDYGGVRFGESMTQDVATDDSENDDEIVEERSTGIFSMISESNVSRILANAFLGVSSLVFVLTFIAFMVSRKHSQKYRDRSDKSQNLLDKDSTEEKGIFQLRQPKQQNRKVKKQRPAEAEQAKRLRIPRLSRPKEPFPDTSD